MKQVRFTLNSARTKVDTCLCVNGCDGASAQAIPNVMIVVARDVFTSHGLFQMLG